MERINGCYTGIGSRDTPEGVYRAMVWIGYQMASHHYKLRSGGASGADTAFSQGVYRWLGDSSTPANHYQEIYLPGHKFNNLIQSNVDGNYNTPELVNWKEATEIAKTLHPVWDRLKPYVKILHTRNVYQVLGRTLRNPSKLLICWAPTRGEGHVKGGTNTAVQLAHRVGVPVYNLYTVGEYERLLDDYRLGDVM